MTPLFVHAGAAAGLVTFAWLVLRLRLPLGTSVMVSRASLAALLLAPLALALIGRLLPPVSLPAAEALVTLSAPSGDESTPAMSPRSAPLEPHASQVVAWTWAGGALVCLSHLGWQFRRLRRHVRTLSPLPADELPGLAHVRFPHGTQFLADPGASGPYSVRCFRPCVVFPSGFQHTVTAEQLTAVLRHEGAHLRHRDAWSLLVWKLVAAACWWHPLAWRLPGLIEALHERRADAESVSSPAEALALSRLLLHVAEMPALAHAARPRNARLLHARLAHLLGPPELTCPAPRKWGLAFCGVASCALIAGCGTLLPRKGVPASTEDLEVTLHRLAQQAMREGKPISGPIIALEVKFFSSDKKQSSNSQPPRTLTWEVAQAEQSRLMAARAVTTTSYPRVITANDREVVIRSVLHRTVPTLDGGRKGTAQVDEGTILRLQPVRQKDGRYAVKVDLRLTGEIGAEVIGGTKYPVFSTSTHTATVKVRSREVVVFEGLSDAQGRAVSMHLGLDVVGWVSDPERKD